MSAAPLTRGLATNRRVLWSAKHAGQIDTALNLRRSAPSSLASLCTATVRRRRDELEGVVRRSEPGVRMLASPAERLEKPCLLRQQSDSLTRLASLAERLEKGCQVG